MTLIVNGGSSDYNDKQIKIEDDDDDDDDDGRKRKRNDILKSWPWPWLNSAGSLRGIAMRLCRNLVVIEQRRNIDGGGGGGGNGGLCALYPAENGEAD